MHPIKPLTPAQRRYLQSFRDDLGQHELGMAEETFVARMAGCNFDGEAKLGEFRVALALQEKGLLARVERHGPCLHYLSVDLTAEGARAMHRVLRACQPAQH